MASALPLFSLLVLLLFCSSNSKVHGGDLQGFEVLKVETLVPATVCIESKVPSGNTMKVVHVHGPCFPSSDGRPDHLQILSQDSLRVAYLQNLVRLANATGNTTSPDALRESLQASIHLPARDGRVIGSPMYVVTVGIGTPKRIQTAIFDTGSHVCWLQCRPCPTRYRQQDPIFDPFASSSYRNITCNDGPCAELPRSQRGCTNNTCTYHLIYGDSSFTAGFLATESLTLGDSNMHISNFVFGCSQASRGQFLGSAGLIGLGREFHSLSFQTSRRFGNVFSYCLPSVASRTGYLALGPSDAPSPSYTPMRLGPHGYTGLYFLDLHGISVGTQQLPISPTAFQSVGTVIDSGTAVSRLPPEAYKMLKDAIRSIMSRHRLVAPIANLDTCYSISNGTGLVFPQITLHLTGLDLLLTPAQTFYVSDDTTFCLAFAPAQKGKSAIIGNIQQRGMEVIYDLRTGRIGFSEGTGCH